MTGTEGASQAQTIIVGMFGGLTEAHRATGITIHRLHYMLKKGLIPERDRQTFLDAAGRLGIEHVPADYITHLRAPDPAATETTG